MGDGAGDGPDQLADDRPNGLSAWLHTRSWRGPGCRASAGDRAEVRVDVTDEGNGGRPCALATVEVAVR